MKLPFHMFAPSSRTDRYFQDLKERLQSKMDRKYEGSDIQSPHILSVESVPCVFHAGGKRAREKQLQITFDGDALHYYAHRIDICSEIYQQIKDLVPAFTRHSLGAVISPLNVHPSIKSVRAPAPAA